MSKEIWIDYLPQAAPTREAWDASEEEKTAGRAHHCKWLMFSIKQI